jgi:hypothetical protein
VKIEICLDRQEIRGNQAVKFEVDDNDGVNIGTLTIGKGSIRWQEPKARGGRAKAKSWSEVIEWLQTHGRTVKQ